MKIKYILGAMGMAFGMTGCNLDITMYDGVMEWQKVSSIRDRVKLKQI